MYRLKQGGFTLLEVMVALAILTITMAALVKGVGANASRQLHLENRTFGQWVALNQIARLQLNPGSPTLGQLSGVDQMAGRAWQWTSNTITTPDPNVYKVSISVTPKDDGVPVAKVVGYIPVSAK